ncbi:hypothetical protein SARC_04872 [Sphaeroforma arctica JP610]|uniref:Uncharacterized protein n=1 Tax=Sphaeroforma arctica JP610 TaxID=667725 RepID=A0A0L0G3Q9_9EUKA|nr:hypothetical protein SARC_04872 [Sphaeroforma arctica JP610]KNC82848.1 hypothetical protein SARC_04872 [Sphaeroforma arctica JP610]|eukprot:XP_014156750.1 hypothetical protein SARC_04872 [Sphaeroforma arctica JP610]
MKWVAALQKTLDHYGSKAENMIGQHHWPKYGNAAVVAHLENYRDTIKFTHDQAVRLLNLGLAAQTSTAESNCAECICAECNCAESSNAASSNAESSCVDQSCPDQGLSVGAVVGVAIAALIVGLVGGVGGTTIVYRRKANACAAESTTDLG